MCPQCDLKCPYWNYMAACSYVRASHLFDNNATVAFALFMSVWSKSIWYGPEQLPCFLSEKWCHPFSFDTCQATTLLLHHCVDPQGKRKVAGGGVGEPKQWCVGPILFHQLLFNVKAGNWTFFLETEDDVFVKDLIDVCDLWLQVHCSWNSGSANRRESSSSGTWSTSRTKRSRRDPSTSCDSADPSSKRSTKSPGCVLFPAFSLCSPQSSLVSPNFSPAKKKKRERLIFTCFRKLLVLPSRLALCRNSLTGKLEKLESLCDTFASTRDCPRSREELERRRKLKHSASCRWSEWQKSVCLVFDTHLLVKSWWCEDKNEFRSVWEFSMHSLGTALPECIMLSNHIPAPRKFPFDTLYSYILVL